MSQRANDRAKKKSAKAILRAEKKAARKEASRNAAEGEGGADGEFEVDLPLEAGFWSRLVQSHFFVVFILVAGYLLRSIALGLKPPHFDEGINGNFVAKLWHDGYYHYDPTNFHGPLYFYFLQFADLLFGRSVEGFRWVTGLISLSCVGLIAMHRRFVGPGAVIAALVVAISTAFVFYARYAIHESLFIFCQLLFSYGFFLWQEEKSRRSVAMMITGVFAAFTVKETFFIFFGTWLIAVLCARIAQKIAPKPWPLAKTFEAEQDEDTAAAAFASDGDDDSSVPGYWRRLAGPNDYIVLLSYAALATVALFTGFFLNPSGYRDMFAALMVWAKTGTGGSGQEKPFIYWSELLWIYEWPCLLALVLALPLSYFLSVRQRIVAFTAFGTWLAYSLIPYKTPWLILNLLWPLAFVFGFALEQLYRFRPFALRAGLALLALATLIVSFKTTLRLNFKDYANEKEKYVYVQSMESLGTVINLIDARIKLHPEAQNLRLYALMRDPWPLPWVFGLYPNLFWGKPETADYKDPSVVMIDEPKRELAETHLVGKFWKVPFQMRDSYDKGLAYFAYEDFKEVMPSDTPVFESNLNKKESTEAKP